MQRRPETQRQPADVSGVAPHPQASVGPAAPAPAGVALPARLAGVAASAGLMVLGFPPHSWLGGWVVVPALAGLIAAFHGVRPKQAAVLGLVGGLVFYSGLLTWMTVLGPDAWLALSLLCASFWVLLGAGLPFLLANRLWWVSVPAAWLAVESLRSRVPWGGFPWGRLAFSQADTPLAGWAPIGGIPAVSLAVLALAMLVLWLFRALVWPAASPRLRAVVRVRLVDRSPEAGLDAPSAPLTRPAVDSAGPRPRLPVPLAGQLVGLIAVTGSVIGIGAVSGSLAWGGPVIGQQPIGIVQGNVPRVGMDFNSQRRAVLDNHVRQTEQLAAAVASGALPQPVAVIWPENSSDIDPFRASDAAAAISSAARAVGAPLLVGAVIANPTDPPRPGWPGTVWNASVVWDPQSGPGQRYVKRHPVPFGEYLPLRGLLSRFITRFERIPRDFAAGDGPGMLDLGPVPSGVLICFEVAYDDLARDTVAAGGQILVVQTNNATYGLTGQPEQQLAMTVLRARETGRDTLVAATSGVSAAITAAGEVTWAAPEFTAAATVANVQLRDGATPAVRIGSLPELVAPLALLLVVLAGQRQRRRGRMTR